MDFLSPAVLLSIAAFVLVAAALLFPGVRELALLVLSGVRGAVRILFVAPFRVSFAVVWFVALTTLLFQAGSIYDDPSKQTTVLLLYTVSLAFFFAETGQPNPLRTYSAADFLGTFLLWAAIWAFVFKLVQPFNPEAAVLSTGSLAILFTHAFVVAIGEELLFRYGIPSLLYGPPMARQVISAVLFGFEHWTAYGHSIANVLFATFLGLVFGTITVRFRRGLIIAMAGHFVWNAATQGFLQ